MTYTIKFASNYPSGSSSPGKTPIIIADNQPDTTSTSLKLWGFGYSPYGAENLQNQVWLLENFCGATAPSNPTFGQLWYDKPNKALKIYKQTNATDATGGWELVGNTAGGGFHTSGTSIVPDTGVLLLDLTGAALKIPNTSVTNSSSFDLYAMNRSYNDSRYLRIITNKSEFLPAAAAAISLKKIRYGSDPTYVAVDDDYTLVHKKYVDDLAGGGGSIPDDSATTYTGGDFGVFISTGAGGAVWSKASETFVTQDRYAVTTSANLTLDVTKFNFVNGRKKFANNVKLYGGIEILNVPVPSGTNSTDVNYKDLANKEPNANVSRLVLRTALAVGASTGTVSMGNKDDILVSQGDTFTNGTGVDYGYKAPVWKSISDLLVADATSKNTLTPSAVPTLVAEGGKNIIKWIVPSGAATIADKSVTADKINPGTADGQVLTTVKDASNNYSAQWVASRQLPVNSTGVLYNNGSGSSWIPNGTEGHVLTSVGTSSTPTWTNISSSYIKKSGDTGIGALSLTNHPFALTDTSTAATSTAALNVATAGWVNNKLAAFSPDNIARLVNGILVGGGIKALPTTVITCNDLSFKRGYLQLAGGIIIQWIESERMTHDTLWRRGELIQNNRPSRYTGYPNSVRTEAELLAATEDYTYMPTCHHASIGKYKYAKPFAQTFISFVTTNIDESTQGAEIDNYMHQAFVYHSVTSNTHGSFLMRFAGDFTTGTALYCTGTMITIGMLAQADL